MTNSSAVIVVVVLQSVAGLGVLACIGLAGRRRELLENGAIAPLAGMAWVGVTAATLATLGWRLDIRGLVVLTVATCFVGAARMQRVGPGKFRTLRPSPAAPWWLERATIGAALLVLGIVSVAAVALFRVKPLAEYDGWAMWGMKSRAIAVLDGADPDLFASSAYSRLHLEYPLLLPSLHALPLQLVDDFSSVVVVLNCLAIGLAGIAAVWGLLRTRVRAWVLLPFVAALASAPAFFGQLATGYADVPVAVFVAAGAVAAARWLLDERFQWLALTTLFVVAAALTKNEGLLFGVATYAALAIAAHGRRRAVALSGLVVALIYAPWRAYVAINDLGAPDYDLSASFNLPWIAGRLDRVPEAAAGLLGRALDDQQFSLLLALGVAATAAVLVAGPRLLGVFAGGFGLLSFAGLTWIYVLTPNDVSDFLSSNGDRVIVSLAVGMAALAPLLFEEAARRLGQEPVPGSEVTRARGGSSSPSEGRPAA